MVQPERSGADKILDQVAKMYSLSAEEFLNQLEERVRKACSEKTHIEPHELKNLANPPENLRKHIKDCHFCQLLFKVQCPYIDIGSL